MSSTDDKTRESMRFSQAIVVKVHNEKELTEVSTSGAKVLANLDLLKEDPMAFLYAWRGTAVLFSFTWTLIIAVCVSVVEWAPAITSAYLLNWKYNFLIDWAEELSLIHI